MSRRYYIGVDGGGTRTRSAGADQTGRVIGFGRAGSACRSHYPRDVVQQNLRQAITRAMPPSELQDLCCVFLGMGGVSTEADKNDILRIVREIPEMRAQAKVVVENDTHAGLVGGLSGRPGIVLIAGTGSACLGSSADGRTHLCGGWGALADDAGSAVWVGVRAIQAAVRSEDGRIGPTSLRKIVFDFLQLRDQRELTDRVHNRGLDRAEIGMLAPKVIDAFRAGDAIAGEILRDAAAQLAQMVATVVQRLGPGDAWEMILVGGLALSGAPFQPMLIDRIHRESPCVRVVEPELPPVLGAVLEAMRQDGVTWTPAVLENLRAARAMCA